MKTITELNEFQLFVVNDLIKKFPETTAGISNHKLHRIVMYYNIMAPNIDEISAMKLSMATRLVEAEDLRSKLITLFSIDESISDTIGFDQLYTQIEHVVEQVTEESE